ncbi:HAAS domain-containing protein [Domibacillus indicus]|uniref:HAAS domain-containing protein n=1 Tax=Domibacillus indicus TaxID=1437523 RepID=UPI00061811B7|nr:hypothetical protein [Domibacillus indicus]
MLSEKSEQFIHNLRLYLITSGKKDKEVEDITAELSDHLAEAEKRGKDIHEITGGSPEAYMESIKDELETDYKGLLKSLPVFFIGVLAYFIMGPAVRGGFSVNIVQLTGFPVVVLVGLAIYIVFLQNAGKKQYSDQKMFVYAMISYFVLTALFVAIMLGGNVLAPPIYTAGPLANNIIAALCAIAFIGLAVWSKTWFTIVIPLILFGPSLVMARMELTEETILYGSAAVTIIACLAIMIWPLLMKAKKQSEN